MSHESIKTKASARLVSIGQGPLEIRLSEDECAAIFVCASKGDAQVLGRWLCEDVLLEVTFRRTEATVPAPPPTEEGMKPVAVLPGSDWRILTEDQAHELGLLLGGSRPTNSTERVRAAQRRLVELGLASFEQLGEGGKPACIITDDGKCVALELGRSIR